MATVTLSYNSSTKTFTAAVTVDPGAIVTGVVLTGPGSGPYSMNNVGNGNWTYTWPSPSPPYPPVPSGGWTATAYIQPPPTTASGSTTV